MDFEQPDIIEYLSELEAAEMDGLEFGVIRMNAEFEVVHYNSWESQLSGLPAEKVLSQNFFVAVAPCTHNAIVSQRFQDETTLDETIDYVFTVKMKPTSVRLRLLKDPGFQHCYVLVEKR